MNIRSFSRSFCVAFVPNVVSTSDCKEGRVGFANRGDIVPRPSPDMWKAFKFVAIRICDREVAVPGYTTGEAGSLVESDISSPNWPCKFQASSQNELGECNKRMCFQFVSPRL